MGKTYKQFFLNFHALKTHFILNTYALVNHGIKFYQFQSLPNLHFYKTLNLEEMTLCFQTQVFPMPREPQREAEFNTIKPTVCRSSYHYPHIKTEAKQIS